MKSINTRQNTLRLLTVFVAFALHKNALSQEYINELPTPITLSPEFSPEYHVNVILNGNRLATRVPIRITDNHYLVPRLSSVCLSLWRLQRPLYQGLGHIDQIHH